MEYHTLTQGTPQWHAHRAVYNNASEAPAMLGESSYMTRTQLLTERATGISPDVDKHTQRRFDDGHKYEALARPLAEEIIGQELFPVVGTLGLLSASFDGLPMDESTPFEHKSLNDAIRACKSAEDLPVMYRIQMEQQLLVCDGEKCLFMATKWKDEILLEQVHFWYYPDLALRERIVQGWEQFNKDLLTYAPKEHAEKPQAATIMQLPTLSIQIRGEVALSNLPAFKLAAESMIASVNTDLTTDQDFSDAEANVKFFADAEKKLEQAKESALGQTADIDELMKTIDFIKDAMRTKRLSLDRMVKDKKDAIKLEILNNALAAYSQYVNELNKEIEPVKLTISNVDFAGAMKNKRTIASLHDSVDSAMATAKIAADAAAKAVRLNLSWIKENAADHLFLFADLSSIALKQADDFQAVVTTRIAAHKEAETEKAAAMVAAQEAHAAKAAQLASEPIAEPVSAPASKGTWNPAKKVTSKKQPAPTFEAIINAVALAFDTQASIAQEWIINAVNQSSQQKAA